MTAQNIEFSNNSLPDVKEMIKKGNIDQALQGLWIETQETVAFQSDLNRVWLEMHAYQSWENAQKFTDDLNAIFAQFLIPQNNIA